MSQPTVSRVESTPGLRDLIRFERVLVDVYCASYAVPSAAVIHETVACVRLAFAAACPGADLLCHFATVLAPATA